MICIIFTKPIALCDPSAPHPSLKASEDTTRLPRAGKQNNVHKIIATDHTTNIYSF